jgi:hypothetical protein
MPLVERIVLPPEDPGRLGGVLAALTTRRAQGAALVGPDGERLDLPPEVFEIFRDHHRAASDDPVDKRGR